MPALIKKKYLFNTAFNHKKYLKFQFKIKTYKLLTNKEVKTETWCILDILFKRKSRTRRFRDFLGGRISVTLEALSEGGNECISYVHLKKELLHVVLNRK